MTRREFLKVTRKAGLALLVGGTIYGSYEAGQFHIRNETVTLPSLPLRFDGLRVAVLSDFHRSLYVSEGYLDGVVAVTNQLCPDLIILAGDYITSLDHYKIPGVGADYISSCFRSLSKLKARIGIFAVTGNHDTSVGLHLVNHAIEACRFVNVTNDGIWLLRGDQRIRICGIGDLATYYQDPETALRTSTDRDCVLMISHNPDYAERFKDRRVKFMISGHTHGGQVVLPGLGAPIVPSKFGQKYRYGTIEAPAYPIYVTSGIGTLPIAIRINCPPEIAMLTLKSGVTGEKSMPETSVKG